MAISIHTTTQVVTYTIVTKLINDIYFNPHHHAGGDEGTDTLTDTPPGISIHTTTQVVTPGDYLNRRNIVYFNPHHHAGGDDLRDQIGDILKISIHTTTQVVTNQYFYITHFGIISIHTTTQVVTALRFIINRLRRFQSTPPRRW